MKGISLLAKLFITWYGFIFISTEILSFFYLLTKPWIVASNILFVVTVGIILTRHSGKRSSNWRRAHPESDSGRARMTNYIIIFLLILTFIQGFYSAPSTTDAMTYQILRAMYWIQEGTAYQWFIRNSHDFMPGFASYILLHLYMIFGGDRMLFFSQWLAYAGSIFLSRTVATQLGANQKLSQIISVLVATIPIVVLQATSTQADMVSALITLLVFHLMLVILNSPSYKNALILGFTLGLGMLVKAPFYIFVIVPLSLFLLLLRKNPKKAIALSTIIISIAFAMNLRYYSQNISLYGSPLGQKFSGKGNTYVNERFDLPSVGSNLIKNTMNNLPVPLLADQVQFAFIKLHSLIGIDIADPKVSYTGLDFKVRSVVYPQEDLAASPLNIFLILLAPFFVFRKSFKPVKKNELRVLYVFLIAAYVMFATILKYESVHNRLLVTFLVEGTIISALILSNFKFGQRTLKLFVFLSILLSFALVFLNVQHPYISYKVFYDKVKSFAGDYPILPEAFYAKPRLEQYFNSRPYWYDPYNKVTDLISKKKYKQRIVIMLMDDEFEYPFWALLKAKGINFYFQQNRFVQREIPYGAIILTTSRKPFVKSGWKTECFKTNINYGYACVSRIGAF